MTTAPLTLATPAPPSRDPLCGFASATEFAHAVRAACSPGGSRDRRLTPLAAPTGYHETGGSSGEGFLVPPAVRDAVWQIVATSEDDDLLSLIDPEPTASNAVTLGVDASTPWGARGVTATWRREATQMTPSRTYHEPRTVKLHELYAFVTATDELLSDAPLLRNRLTVSAGQAIRYTASEAMMRGLGVGQPLGWLEAPALITVAKEASQTADTLEGANLAKMFGRLLPAAARFAVWLINPDAFPQLPLLTVGAVPVWTPSPGGFRNASGGLLLGRPVLPCEHCSTIGEVGDIQLVAPGPGYYGAVAAGPQPEYAESMHLFFDYKLTAFRWTFRFGGAPLLSAPITPPRSTSTRSHFVVLEAR